MVEIKKKYYATPHVFWGVIISFFLANLLILVIDPTDDTWQQIFYFSPIYFIVTIVSGILIYLFLFIVLNYTIKKLDQVSLLNHKISYYFLITNLVVFLSMLFLLFVETIFYETFFDSIFDGNDDPDINLRIYIIVNLIVAALLNSYYSLLYFHEKYIEKEDDAKQLLIETHQLKEVALQTELEVLKFQLDPHFLFNSFSTLTYLIETNKEKAALYLENLSMIYRYLTMNGKKNVVSISEELNLIKSYYELIKIRHPQNIILNVEVEESIKALGIAPITLQLLVENAIKHNKYTLDKPLILTIKNEGTKYMVVRNNLQSIDRDYESTGIGIKNIVNRYKILSDIPPEFVRNDQHFEVKIPILDLN